MAAHLTGRRLLLASIAALAIVVLTPIGAWAHAGFASSQPEPGAELGTAPGVVVLRFSEPLNAKLSRATVSDPDGRRFTGTVTQNEDIRIPVSSNVQGIYRVDWTTVSLVDGHTISGSFAFGVGVSPGPGALGGITSEPGTFDLALAIGRAVEDAALLLVMGMLLVRTLARREPALVWVEHRVRQVLVPALAVALLAGLVVVTGEALAAAPKPALSPVITYLTTGVPGAARLLRVALEVAALGASFLGVGLTVVPVAAAMLALAGAGHANAVDPRSLGIAVEWVHLLSAGMWAGGILSLATLRPPAGWRSEEGRALLDRFSPVALGAFSVTVATGVVRGVQEVGNVGELFTSAYGLVLVAKALGVAVMAQLSVLAWRRMLGSLRAEAAVALLVIGAAALLAAFPLPPARVTAAEAAGEAMDGSALPRAGDLTLGGEAGEVLVGLTLRPGLPGANDILIYLLPLEGEDAAAGLVARLEVDGRDVPMQQCGPACRTAHAAFDGGDMVQVRVEGPIGGTASFRIPSLPALDGTGILPTMMRRMHELTSYRQDEILTSGQAVVDSRYAFVAPDEMSQEVNESGSRSRVIWIGGARYLKPSPAAPWQVERGGPAPSVPSFVWDFFRPFIDARVLGSARVDSVPTTIVAFFGDSGGLPVWFRLWIDARGLVHRAEMRAQGHFMDHRYYDFDAPIQIVPPNVKGGD
jgi:copper transport protein